LISASLQKTAYMLTVILTTLKKGLFDAAMLKPNYEELVCKIHLSMRGHKDKQGKFDWVSAVLDALIISGMTFFTGLGTLASSTALSPESLCVLLSAVGAEFLGILATKRGLVQKTVGSC
jgi:hypothetical protein